MGVLDALLPGGLAALLTLATFICRDMRRLRLRALVTRAAFIGYRAAACSMTGTQGLATEPRLIDSGCGPLSSCASAAAKTLPAAAGSTPSARSAANAWSPNADRAAASTAAADCASSACRVSLSRA